ncbi:MAG: GGDEF domain-containing protein, partial [Actinomycetota bacterium]|nr:GGDEF domain-containing protein [Actinomycetota bacterium]
MGGRKQEVERLRESLNGAQRRIAALEAELRARRSTDPLTGLPVLDELTRRLGQEIERSRRHGQPLSVAVLDLDGFRAINAHHGRDVGDRVLVAVGRLLGDLIRASDAASRAGADEFVVMLPETTADEALQAFERYFLQLEALRVGD